MDSIEIGKLKANPYKKEINKGKMNEVQIKEISGNLKELGYMGAIPVVKIKGVYHLVNSHHRIEALKRKFGNKYKVAITIHDYNDDQLLRGMVIENLSQRGTDFREERENIKAVEEYLNKNKKILHAVRDSRGASKGIDSLGRKNKGSLQKKDYQNGVTAKDIQQWLQLSKEKWGDGTITNIMNIYKKLNKDLLEDVNYVRGGHKEEESHLSVEDARNLSRIEVKEQKKIQKILDDTGLDHKAKSRMITNYVKSDETTKRLVLEKKIDIASLVPDLKNRKGELVTIKPKNLNEEITELNDVSLAYTRKLKEFSSKHLKKCNKSQINFLKLHVMGQVEQLKNFADKLQEELK